MKKLFLIAFILGFVFNALGSPARAAETSFEEDSSLPLVFVNVVFKSGSVTDPKGQSGISNFMAEMLLRGTQKRDKEQIALALDQMGARIDVETRAEAVILRGAVLASQLKPFLDLLEEILTQPSFPDGEIRKLKSEVVSAILEESGHDQTLTSRGFEKFLFRGHPYGKPVLGVKKDIEGLTNTQLQAQYARTIRSDLMLVIGSGDSGSGTISRWADQVAAKRGGGNAQSEFPVAAPEDKPGRRMLIIDKPERTQTQILIGQVGLKMNDRRFFPLHIANYAFGGPSFSSRLMVEIRVKRGWSYGANSHFRFGREPRQWQVHLFPASKDAPNALGYTLQMLEELRKKGITPEEFEFSKRSLVNSSGFMYDTPAKRIENKILEKTLNLPDGLMKRYGTELEKVKLADVNSAVRDFLKPGEVAITVLATAKDLKEALVKAAGPGTEVTVLPYTEE